MLVCPCGLDVSSSALRFLSSRLREHRRGLGTRWRRLSAGRQALLALAHLRNGHPYVQLAAGFGVGTTTAYRYVTEAVEVLAALAPTLAEAVRGGVDEGVRPAGRDAAADRPNRRRPAFLLGQAQETRDERAGDRRSFRPPAVGLAGPARSRPRRPCRPRARHHRHACHSGRQLLGRQGLPGRRRHGPCSHRGRWETLSAGQQAVNRSHAKIRALVEQAVATLKSWRLLRRLRCSTTRITVLVQAVLCLHQASSA